jgi:hypothetical protein
MKKNILYIASMLLFTGNVFSQSSELSKQELEVIKSYKFDIVQAQPLFLEYDKLEEPTKTIENLRTEVQLLPLELDEIEYAIKPKAFEVNPPRYYNGYAGIRYGNLENLDLYASFQKQVSNYFLLGIEGNYFKIKDSEILDKNVSSTNGKAFIQYFLNNKTWIKLKTEYQQNQNGLFGYNDEQTVNPDGVEQRVENKNIQAEAQIKHYSDKNRSLAFSYQINASSSQAVTFDAKEFILYNKGDIRKDFGSHFFTQISAENRVFLNSINESESRSFSSSQITLGWLKSNFGIVAEGFGTYYLDEFRIAPKIEMYFTKNEHKLNLHYSTSLEPFSYRTALDKSYTYAIPASVNYALVEINSLGGSYEYEKKHSHMFDVGIAYEKYINSPVIFTSLVQNQLFEFQYLDFDQYKFDLNYRISILPWLTLGQDMSYRYLQNVEKEQLPHNQIFTFLNTMEIDWKRLSAKVNYTFGDNVLFTKDLNYETSSTYEHDLSVSLDYRIHDQIRIEARGIDLLNNRFEQFAGYQGFGRRFQVGIFSKF